MAPALGWLLFLSLCLAAATAPLPWSPGYALALNSRNLTEYAYSYPRRLYQQFTVEMWVRGAAQVPDNLAILSISHPKLDNAVVITNYVSVDDTTLSDVVLLPPNAWTHLAVSVDLTSYPDCTAWTYIDGRLAHDWTAPLVGSLGPADFEEEALAIVFGQEQDSQLGDWSTQQILSGHLDEVRIWNTIRTASEIQANYGLSLTAPYPPALVSYYTFDTSNWDAPYHVDQVNDTERTRLYLADYAIPSAAPTPPPAPSATTPTYAPPASTPARLALSSAPLCATDPSVGFAAVRATPGGNVSIAVASLYCGASGPMATVVVTAVSGGIMSRVSPATLTFTADSAGVAADAGFNFTVTDGAASVAGFVAVWLNHAPTLPDSLTFVGDEDDLVSSWIAVMDEDRDIVTVAVAAAPALGVAQLDGYCNRSLQYAPPPNAHGSSVGVFALQAVDMWGSVSSKTPVTVMLKPVPDQPQLLMNLTYSIYRGQRIPIPFQAVDVDGNDPFVVVSDWPTAAQGVVEGSDDGERWTINELSASSKMEWASGTGNYSSTFYNHQYPEYDLPVILGPPQCPGYRDCSDAWCPSTLDGGCVNRASAAEAYYVFYTEFFEVNFTVPVYLTNVIVVENFGSDRITRVLVPSDRDRSKWKTVMWKDIENTPSSSAVAKYSKTSLSVCQVLWPVDRVRVEVDTCHRSGWYEVDAIQIRGGIVAPKNVLNTTAQLFFRATPGFTGNATFGLAATTCYGSYEATSDLVTVTVEVRDTPHVLTVAVVDGWFSVDVGQLNAGPRSGNVLVLELPAGGTISYGGSVVNETLIDLGGTATVFEYEAFHCAARLADTFIVQLGPTAVVQVLVRGCSVPSSILLPTLVPSVVVPTCLVGLLLLWRWMNRGHRDNSRAPRDPNRDICVLFTDIQSSTLLWGEVPDVMSVALDVHNTIIRKLIAKYRCYEVKTIGDSFMVAVEEPALALQLALSLQEALFDRDWDGFELDDVYRRLTACDLPAEIYDRLWNGLRVRVGMHYGRAQIHFDETTKGYDYYGTVVNAAARIESVAHGGQVIVSRQLFDQVAHQCSAYRVATQPLGSVLLRGLPAPLDLIQIVPASFAERVFPPLRLDKVGDEDRDDLEESSLTHSQSTSNSEPGRPQFYPYALDREAPHHPLVRSGNVTPELAVFHAYDVFYTLKAQLQMFKTPDERKKRLRELCQQWHVPCKVGTDQQENASLGKLALQLMGSVVKQMHPAAKPRGNSRSSKGTLELRDLPPSPRPHVLPPAHSDGAFSVMSSDSSQKPSA